jgi:hypothetical protein
LYKEKKKTHVSSKEANNCAATLWAAQVGTVVLHPVGRSQSGSIQQKKNSTKM